jgi:hypothetical protein
VLATPFVQGRLREEKLEVSVVTECAMTGCELRMVIDSDLEFRVVTRGADPYVFQPHVDWGQFSAPNIIHDY